MAQLLLDRFRVHALVDEQRDAGMGPPFEAGPRKPDSGSGSWELFLVDAVATSWGVEPEGGGKKVWFEVGTP